MKNFQPLGILAASLMIALASLTATAQDMPDNAAPQDDGNAGNQAASPVQTKLSDLRNALGDGSSSDAEIQQKVAALRAARADAQAALSKAQSNLEKSLTSRQQAELIAMGILD